jgi:hypothetical protein
MFRKWLMTDWKKFFISFLKTFFQDRLKFRQTNSIFIFLTFVYRIQHYDNTYNDFTYNDKTTCNT